MSMRIPTMASTIERRLLVNFDVDPDAISTMLPGGMRPQIVRGRAVAGVCLIRLGAFRPAFIGPGVGALVGWGAENAAHRIAVEWDEDGVVRTGVYIPRRHTASRLAGVAGGRIFPGRHDRAVITSDETLDRLHVRLDAADLHAEVGVTTGASFESELFGSLAEASEFFRKDDVGWSPTGRAGRLEGLRLGTDAWAVQAARGVRASTTFFDALPADAARLDHVLLMRNVPAVWTAPSIRFREVGLAA